jgi:glycosyltransferase involved in cell wall biosynthesis
MPKAAGGRAGRALSAALLQAQRRSGRVPAPVRRIGRRLLTRAAAGPPPIDGWSSTLLGGAPLGTPPAASADGAAVAPSPLAPGGLPGPRLRCFVVTGVLDVGGEDEVVAFLGRRLGEHGLDTWVLHSGVSVGVPGSDGGRLAADLRAEGVRIEDVTETSARELIERHRPDVISAHGAPAWWIDLAAEAGVPYLETLHGMHNFFGADWAREAVRSERVARIIAVSELVRRQYLAGNGAVEPERVVTVPNSVDQLRFPRLDRDRCREWLGLGDEFLFVSLARHSLQKNTYGLVAAFADVAARHPEAHLLIAGRPDDPHYAQQVARLRDGLACRDRIHLRDHAPWPAALLTAADAFVLDSFFEGWSLASMEALAAGLPVVLSDVGGAREQVGAEGERGHLVGNPIGDPLAVDWDSIRTALFAPQPNRAELVAAMSATIAAREEWAARRERLRGESAVRFHPDRALSGHAAVLREAAAAALTLR